MKKLAIVTAAAVAGSIALVGAAWAQCATIQDGTILASTGETLATGYDDFGYNYQAHLFNGRYCDVDRAAGGASCDVDLIMKWNDAWLSNKDCGTQPGNWGGVAYTELATPDNKLDRHYPLSTYIGSEAWITNHQAGWDADENGRMRKWTYFVKIVAAPSDAVCSSGTCADFVDTWDTAGGVEIGPVIWGSFAIIEEIYNDPFNGYHGALYVSPAGPGFGHFD